MYNGKDTHTLQEFLWHSKHNNVMEDSIYHIMIYRRGTSYGNLWNCMWFYYCNEVFWVTMRFVTAKQRKGKHDDFTMFQVLFALNLNKLLNFLLCPLILYKFLQFVLWKWQVFVKMTGIYHSQRNTILDETFLLGMDVFVYYLSGKSTTWYLDGS